MHEICPNCGKESLEESPRFCSGCGARLDGKSPAGYPYTPIIPVAGHLQKSPFVAGIFSTILPGLGQVYNGEFGKGFALFILTLAGLVFLVIPGLIVWFYAMYNAYITAGKMNSGELQFRETRTIHMILFVVFAVAVVVIAVVLVYFLVIEPLVSGLSGSFDMGDLNRLMNTNGLF